MRAEERVYRPAAVRRLAAGDALDDLPRFVPAHEWLAVAAAGLLLAAALAWGVFGSVAAPGASPGAAAAAVPCDTAAAPAAERIRPIRLLVPAGR
jgi:hypothetical protein